MIHPTGYYEPRGRQMTLYPAYTDLMVPTVSNADIGIYFLTQLARTDPSGDWQHTHETITLGAGERIITFYTRWNRSGCSPEYLETRHYDEMYNDIVELFYHSRDRYLSWIVFRKAIRMTLESLLEWSTDPNRRSFADVVRKA
jgi:hypothetical protein